MDERGSEDEVERKGCEVEEGEVERDIEVREETGKKNERKKTKK